VRALALVASVSAALLAASALPAPARADADPASDFLISQNTYLPFFGGRASKESEEYLGKVVDAANRSGYPIRVAVIGTRRDLGGVFTLFGKPQQYAPFLGREIAFQYRGRLLTSMPAGFGFYWQGHDTAREKRLLATVPVEPGLDGVVDSTAEAVKKLAAADGHPIAVEKSSSGDSGVPTRLIIGIGGAVILAALVLVPVLLRRRRRATA
jgi:hypothetical protein